MNYTKPEMFLMGKAAEIVQMHTKGGGNIENETSYTTAAYEADE